MIPRPPLSLVLAVSVSAALLAPTGVASAVLPVCDGTWHVEAHPDDGQVLHAVSARWLQGAWAVGSVLDDVTGSRRTYIERWNGSGWKRVPSPNATRNHNELWDVAGIGADVWAVGDYLEVATGPGAPPRRPLIMYYDGSGWDIVPGDPAIGEAALTSVWKVGPDDVWAVGTTSDGARPVAEHWDGAAWASIPIPDPTPSSDALTSVSASATDDVWAVGSAADGTETLAMHWDGDAWTRVPIVDPDSVTQRLGAVTVRRDGTAFAVGSYVPSTDVEGARTLAEHWMDGRWRRMTTPNPSSAKNVLAAVDRGPHNLQKVWAVGARTKPDAQGRRRPLILRLTRDGWIVDPSPDPFPDGSTELADVAVFGIPTFDSVGAVAVGNGYNLATGERLPVIMRRCGP